MPIQALLTNILKNGHVILNAENFRIGMVLWDSVFPFDH